MRSLVVGVDGSPSSLEALRWAAGTVDPDGAVLALVAVRPKPELAEGSIDRDSIDDLFRLEQELDRLTRRASAGVESISVAAVGATAADALRTAACDHGADAIVVGTHMSALGMPKRLGSTLKDLMADLSCPLVVVPDPPGPGVPNGPIVVGAGYGPATRAAVCWAASRADEADLPLAIVRATSDRPVFQIDGWLNFVAYYLDPSMRDEWTREDLDEFARLAQLETSADIEIATAARPGHPATRLVDESERASLLVIGQHHSWGRSSQHVAQPLHHALTHAQCPVVVIPAPESEPVAAPAADTPEPDDTGSAG